MEAIFQRVTYNPRAEIIDLLYTCVFHYVGVMLPSFYVQDGCPLPVCLANDARFACLIDLASWHIDYRFSSQGSVSVINFLYKLTQKVLLDLHIESNLQRKISLACGVVYLIACYGGSHSFQHTNAFIDVLEYGVAWPDDAQLSASGQQPRACCPPTWQHAGRDMRGGALGQSDGQTSVTLSLYMPHTHYTHVTQIC